VTDDVVDKFEHEQMGIKGYCRGVLEDNAWTSLATQTRKMSYLANNSGGLTLFPGIENGYRFC
jgi:hypothetical protein